MTDLSALLAAAAPAPVDTRLACAGCLTVRKMTWDHLTNHGAEFESMSDEEKQAVDDALNAVPVLVGETFIQGNLVCMQHIPTGRPGGGLVVANGPVPKFGG